MDSLEVLIPVPRSRKKNPGHLSLADIRSLFAGGPFASCRAELEAMLAGFCISLKQAKTRKQAQLALVEDRKLQPEAFRISITPDGICLEASELRGARYALGALRQILFHDEHGVGGESYNICLVYHIETEGYKGRNCFYF